MIRVFVSSIMGELKTERQVVKKAIEDLYLEPVMFEDFPAISKRPKRAYLDHLLESDIVVLLLGEDVTEPVRTEFEEAMSRGKSVLIFVKEGVKRTSRLRSFLDEVEHVLTYKTFSGIYELQDSVKLSLVDSIAEKFKRAPTITRNREEHYRVATELIRYSERRLYIIERTPVLLLGYRQYAYEKEFHDVLRDWVYSTVRERDRRCRSLFCIPDTRQEIIAENKQDRFRERLQEYKRLEKLSEGRFLITSIPQYYGSFIVGDNDCAIWFKGKDDAISIYYEDEQMAEILVQVFYRLIGKKSKDYETILAEL